MPKSQSLCLSATPVRTTQFMTIQKVSLLEVHLPMYPVAKILVKTFNGRQRNCNFNIGVSRNALGCRILQAVTTTRHDGWEHQWREGAWFETCFSSFVSLWDAKFEAAKQSLFFPRFRSILFNCDLFNLLSVQDVTGSYSEIKRDSAPSGWSGTSITLK